jgi:hypothetical protein
MIHGIGPSYPKSRRRLHDRLTLVGTVHRDPAGYSKCVELLRSLSPDLVLVELSPFGLFFRKRNGRRLQRTLRGNLEKAARTRSIMLDQALIHPEIEAIRIQLNLPFEYRAAVAYSKETGADYRLVDSSYFSRRLIESWPDLITTENLEWLLSSPSHVPPVATLYQTAARLIRGGNLSSASGEEPVSPDDHDDDDDAWRAREFLLAARINSHLAAPAPSKPVYLGGWTHLTAGGRLPTLRDILGAEPSRCILLPSADPVSRPLASTHWDLSAAR